MLSMLMDAFRARATVAILAFTAVFVIVVGVIWNERAIAQRVSSALMSALLIYLAAEQLRRARRPRR